MVNLAVNALLNVHLPETRESGDAEKLDISFLNLGMVITSNTPVERIMAMLRISNVIVPNIK